MNTAPVALGRLAALLLLTGAAVPSVAQDATPTDTAAPDNPETIEVVPVRAADAEAPPPTARERATELDAVEVTGSRIARTDYETAQPILAISREDIDRTGLINIGDLLQDLPGTGSALNTQFNNGGTGATEVDLRNLGSNRVLVLVNGHRWVNGLRSLSTSSVDLNTIPLGAIERVEILKDGASAIYGSDAIAGVVNIITKKNVEGLAVSSQYGQYEQGDGRTQEHNLSYGTSFTTGLPGTTNFFGNFSYAQSTEVFARDREISRLPRPGTGLTRASSFIPEGRILFVPDVQNAARLGTGKCPGIAGGVVQGALDDEGVPVTVPPQVAMVPGLQLCDLIHIAGAGSNATTDYRRFVAGPDSFNFSDISYLATPLKTYSGFTTISHQFGNGFGLNFEGLYNLRKSSQRLAAQPLCVGEICPIIGGQIPGQGISYNQATFAPADHPFNPFGQDVGSSAEDPTGQGLIGTGAILRRVVEIADRDQIQETPTVFARLAAHGDFVLPFSWSALQPFTWEIGYSYGRTKQDNVLAGQIDMQRLMLGIGPTANCTGDCVPVDFFGGQGALTQEMIDYIAFTAYESTEQKQSNLFAGFSTSLNDVLPAGPLGVAFGFEMRKDDYNFLPDSHAIDGTTSGLPQKPTAGTVEAKEAFMELAVPLYSGVQFFEELELSLAGRYSRYEQFGSALTGKAGLRWKPYQDLLVRTTYSNSFRAPDVGNLFLGQASSYPALVDPCVPGETSPRQDGNNVDQNCSADGVDDSVTQDFLQILSPFGGNEELKPETSNSFTFGVIFAPQYAPGLEVAVDYFNITLKNFITAPGGQFVLDQCYGSDPDARSDYCRFISRNPSNNQLQSVLNLFNNFPRIETTGVDFGVGYSVPTEEQGTFRFAVDASYLIKYDQFTEDAAGKLEKERQAGTYDGNTAWPRWKINPSLNWSRGPMSASWSAKVVYHVIEPCNDGIPPSLVSLGVCSDPNNVDDTGAPDPQNKIDTAVRHDLQFGYALEEAKLDFIIGVQNALDRDPPISYATQPAIGYNPSDYWIPGRLPYLRLKKTF
jgi:iron complex outermembrane recepter protein